MAEERNFRKVRRGKNQEKVIKDNIKPLTWLAMISIM